MEALGAIGAASSSPQAPTKFDLRFGLTLGASAPARGTQSKIPPRTAVRLTSQKSGKLTQLKLSDAQQATNEHTAAVRTFRAAYPLTLKALRPGLPNGTCPDRRPPFVTRHMTSSYK